MPKPPSQTRTVIDNLQIISYAGELFNHVDKELPMWAGDGVVRKNIVFEHAFKAPPNVSLGLSGIDAAHDQNLRFRLDAINVKATDFTIEFST